MSSCPRARCRFVPRRSSCRKPLILQHQFYPTDDPTNLFIAVFLALRPHVLRGTFCSAECITPTPSGVSPGSLNVPPHVAPDRRIPMPGMKTLCPRTSEKSFLSEGVFNWNLTHVKKRGTRTTSPPPSIGGGSSGITTSDTFCGKEKHNGKNQRNRNKTGKMDTNDRKQKTKLSSKTCGVTSRITTHDHSNTRPEERGGKTLSPASIHQYQNAICMLGKPKSSSFYGGDHRIRAAPDAALHATFLLVYHDLRRISQIFLRRLKP